MALNNSEHNDSQCSEGEYVSPSVRSHNAQSAKDNVTHLFSVGYGSENREQTIRACLDTDGSLAVVKAAIHFEWTLKRVILVLGKSNTKELRGKLRATWTLGGSSGEGQAKSIPKLWHEEVGSRFRNASLDNVVATRGVLHSTRINGSILDAAKGIRGEIVHGNGTVSKRRAVSAVEQYLIASKNLREFALKVGKCDIDKRLVGRRKALK